MKPSIQQAVDRIGSLPADWHLSGTMSHVVLSAIAQHIERLGSLRHSAETGSGKTTLLFSQLSENHTVFALDGGESITRVRESSLFLPERVTYVVGPSQLTLPRHVFANRLQMVLIDGPHGYPFPDLEYYYLYPHIETGGLMIIDDVNIPTIGRMLDIIKAGDMFELIEVVQYTAFLRRTSAPLIDPLGDSWWLQGFNREHYEYAMARESQTSPSALRGITRFVPSSFKRQIPIKWKTKLLRKL
jgi:hypothetical protein